MYLNGSENTFQVPERESGLLDWRTEDGTRFLVTLSHDVSTQNSRVRLRLGDALDWTASCPYLEVRARVQTLCAHKNASPDTRKVEVSHRVSCL